MPQDMTDDRPDCLVRRSECPLARIELAPRPSRARQNSNSLQVFSPERGDIGKRSSARPAHDSATTLSEQDRFAAGLNRHAALGASIKGWQ